jgi:DNA-binding CsgD family transcriptional regulator/tetratricopeptide (TPR) repeat protein
MLTPTLVCPELIGRRRELDALAEWRRAAAGGHGSLVLIGGDAGIGKTRLLAAFRESLTNGRAAIGSGRYEEFANVPYAAIADALSGICGRQAFPAERTRAEQLAAMRNRVAAVCARRSVVLMLEDVHWADEASFTFLLHLMGSLRGLRLLVVATYRSDELHRAHAATPFVARLARHPLAHRVSLGPLAMPEMQRLVRAATQGLPTLSRADVAGILERSDGNPFFAEELLKNAFEHRDGGGLGLRLPLTIRAAVAERFALLHSDARAVISLGAIVGRRFEAEFIAKIADRPLDAILDALRAARDLQLIDEFPTHPASYAFRHALTREAIYDEMLVADVRPLHRQIVTVLERGGTSGHSADLGYHAWAARDGAKAVEYNERAGDEAQVLHAYADAVRSYGRALEFAAGDDVRGRLLEKSARSSAHDGNALRAARLAQAAIEAYERAGTGYERISELCYVVAAELHVAGECDRAISFLREGLLAPRRWVRPDDRARLALPLAYMLLDRGSVAEAAALVDESSAAADSDFAHMYWNTRMYLATLRADLTARDDAAARYRQAAASSDVERRFRAHVNIGINLSALGNDLAAEAEFRAIDEERGGRPVGAMDIYVRGYSVVHHLRAGRLFEARSVAERLLAMDEPWITARMSVASAALMVGRALCDDDLSVRAGAADLLEAAFATQVGIMIGRFAGPYARRLHDRGQHQDALAVLRRAMRAISGAYGATETLLAVAELGDAQLRSDAFAAIEPATAVPLYTATAAHMRALVACRTGDNDGARGYASDAQRLYLELGWSYHRAQCVELAGDASAAAEAFRAMGATFDVRRLLDRELGSAADHGTARDSTSLSPAEWRVAELVAAGTPNRAVAERLTVSEKTVEKHVTAIYRKLGFRNRSELTAFVVRKGA